MKKSFVVITVLALLFGNSVAGFSQEKNIYESENYTFSSYSKVLQNELYPEIQNVIDYYGFSQSSTREDMETLPDEVAETIKKYNQDRKIYNTIHPMVVILRLENKSNVIFMLEIKMELFDAETSIENVFNTSVLFVKRFVLIATQKENKVTKDNKLRV